MGGSVGFTAMVVGSLVLGRAFAREGRIGLARWSRLTSLAFALSIVAVGTGSAQPALVIGFTAGVIAVFAFIAGVAWRQYRRVAASDRSHA